MPAAIAIPAIAAVVGAGASLYGQHKASQQQSKASDQAIDYQREQDAEHRREFDVQEAARKQEADQQIAYARWQWQAQQAQLAPYRAARESVLAKYGIKGGVPVPEMPDFAAMGGGIAPGAPPPGTQIPHRSVGGGAGLMALGAGIGASGLMLSQALKNREAAQRSAYGTPSAGSVPTGKGGVGYAMQSGIPVIPADTPGGPVGPPGALAFDPPDLSNWAAYQTYGYPGDASGYSD